MYLLLISLAFMRPQIKIGEVAITPTDFFAALLGLFWVTNIVARRGLVWDPIITLLLVYLGAVLVSAAFAIQPFVSFFLRIIGEAYLLAIPIMILGVISNEIHLRRACLAWLVGTSLVIAVALVSLIVTIFTPGNSLLPLVQHYLGSLPLGPFIRFKLTYENPNMLGAYLTASLMVILLAGDRGWLSRFSQLLLVAGLGIAMVMTFSAGIGAAVLGAGVWVWARQRKIRPNLSRLALTAGITVGLAFSLSQVVTPVRYPNPPFSIQVPGTDVTLVPSSRLRVWVDTWDTFTANPLTGVGPGNPVADVWFDEPSGARPRLRDGHNVFLNVAAETGVVGLAAFIAILVALWRRTGRWIDLSTNEDMARAAFGMGVFNVFVYQGIGGGFEDSRFAWAMIGLLLVSARLGRVNDGGKVQPCRAFDMEHEVPVDGAHVVIKERLQASNIPLPGPDEAKVLRERIALKPLTVYR
jgi:putative inorganic carbon (hco3(-)) transporter